MDPIARERLFGFRHAFDSPVTLWITIAVIAALLIASVIIWLLHTGGRTSDKLHDELVKRVVSWAVMTPLLLGPVLLGAAWTILAVAILSVLCYREFARATGFFRYRSLSIVVVLGIIATTFAIADHWYGFFVAIPPLTMVLLAIVAVLRDEPRGYTQRVGAGSGVDTPVRLIGLGLIVSVAGQFGDLMVSSIKRDIGIKDMGASIPGHGGLLDRFDSMLLVAPAVFYYIGFFRGFGLDQPNHSRRNFASTICGRGFSDRSRRHIFYETGFVNFRDRVHERIADLAKKLRRAFAGRFNDQ